MWQKLLRQFENTSRTSTYIDKLKDAMRLAREYKHEFYLNKLSQLNQKIVKQQIDVLQSWCQFGLRKAWLYYADMEGSLQEISCDWSPNELQNLSVFNPPRELTKGESKDTIEKRAKLMSYLVSMGGELNKNISLTYLSPKTQCSTFNEHWVKDTAEDANQEMRQIVNAQVALNEIETNNPNFFQSLIEAQRIGNIIKTIDSSTSSSDKRVQDFRDVLFQTERAIFGASRDDIKEQLALMIDAFVKNPTANLTSHLNISLTGPPGVGKTTMAKYIGKIMSLLGLLVKGDSVSTHTRATMVAQFIGQTAPKVESILTSNLEGVVFIDEAYALAQASGSSAEAKFDQYGEEALNTIVDFLGKYAGQICIIAAGYKQEMQTFFFGPNEGMARRFKWHWDLPPFSSAELFCIITLQLQSLDSQCRKRSYVRETIDDFVSQQGQLLLNSVLHDETSLGNFGFRSYFQNEGGDAEKIAANISAAFYELGKRQLNDRQMLQVLWNYIKQRDGSVFVQRGLPQKYPAKFIDISNVDLQPSGQYATIINTSNNATVSQISLVKVQKCDFAQKDFKPQC